MTKSRKKPRPYRSKFTPWQIIEELVLEAIECLALHGYENKRSLEPLFDPSSLERFPQDLIGCVVTAQDVHGNWAKELVYYPDGWDEEPKRDVRAK